MAAPLPLILHLALTAVFSLLALISTALVLYRLHSYERARLNDAESHAFRLLDEMLRSLLPRNLGKKLSELYKIEAGSTTNDKAMAGKPKGETTQGETTKNPVTIEKQQQQEEPAYENIQGSPPPDAIKENPKDK